MNSPAVMSLHRFGDVISLLHNALRRDEELIFIGQSLERPSFFPVWLLVVPILFWSSSPVITQILQGFADLFSVPVYGFPIGSTVFCVLLGCAVLFLIARVPDGSDSFDSFRWWWRPDFYAVTDQRLLKINQRGVTLAADKSQILSVTRDGVFLTVVIQSNVPKEITLRLKELTTDESIIS